MQIFKNVKDDIGQYYLPNDISRARLGLLLLIIPLASFILIDFLYFGLSWEFYVLAAMRSTLLIYTIFHLVHLKSMKKYAPYTKAMLVYAFILIASNSVVNAREPSNFVAHTIIVMLVVFVFYLVIPNKFVYQTTLSLTAIISEVLIILLGANAGFMDLFQCF